MQLWRRTERVDTHAENRAHQQQDGGQYHGPYSDSEYSTVWHVSVTIEPDGRCSNCGGFGGSYPHALCAYDSYALGRRRTKRDTLQRACIGQYFYIELRLGGGDHVFEPGAGLAHDSVRIQAMLDLPQRGIISFLSLGEWLFLSLKTLSQGPTRESQ